MSDPIPLSARRRGRPPSAHPSDGGSEIQSLDRAICILEVLAGVDHTPLAEISRRTELPISTVHRQLQTLERRGLVAHDAESGQWSVGVGLFRIGSAYLRIRKLPEIARPVLRELQQSSDETVNLSLLEETSMVCVAQAESHASVRAFFRLGRQLPLHASAAGKALLARSAPADRDRLLLAARLTPYTPNTHATREALLADLELTLARGYAIDNEEHSLGMRCVAATILNEFGEPIGSMSISAPKFRMPEERLAALGGPVRDAGRQLTALYSGRRLHDPDPPTADR